MKAFLKQCLTIAFCLSITVCYSQSASYPVTIIKDKQSTWQITPISKNKETLFAADELKKYLGLMGSASIKISPTAQNKGNIIIGLKKDIPKKYRTLLAATAKGYNGYSVTVSSNPSVIVIAGDDAPGMVYGAYDLLEKLGCRWYYPQHDVNDKEVVPLLNTVMLNTQKWSTASQTQYRICNGDAWFFKMDYDRAKEQVDWAMKNRYNSMGWQAQASNDKISLIDQYKKFKEFGVEDELNKRGMFIHGPAHSFDQLLNTDIYFKDHPEWFGLRDGKRVPQAFVGAQFCWSNANARKEFVKNAIEFINHAPLIKIFSNIPFDGGIPCACDNCTKIGASNLLMTVVGDLADALKTTHPDVMVETIGGYGAVPDPPTNLDVINPRLRIVWAQWGRNHEVGYNDAKYDRANLDNWRKAAKGGLTICQYYADNFAEPWVMGPFSTAMISDREYFLKHNVNAMYMLIYPKGYWWNHGLNAYLGGRTFFDVKYNPFSDINDYAINYFGSEAGKYLAEYYQAWAKNIALSYHVRDDTNNEERALLAEQQKKLIEPAIEAAKGNKLYAYRVNKVAKLHSLAESLAEGHRLRDVIGMLRKEKKFEDASKVLEKARKHTDSTLELFYKLADMDQGLIERAEVGSFIKMGVKNWIQDEEKLIAAKDPSPRNANKKLSETEMLPADVLNQQ